MQIHNKVVDPLDGDSPRLAGRIQVLVVTAAGELDIFGSSRSARVRASDLNGNVFVGVAVNDEVRNIGGPVHG
jgi:hypothetical protein